MKRSVSKAALVRHIKALEREIDAIWAFHALPVKTVKWRGIEVARNTPGFISLCQYGYRYCLHPGEVGYVKGIRYRMNE